MSIYVQSNQIISELRCHRNLSTSSKTVPLCLKQVLVVRTSLIQISDTRTSFLTILRFLCVVFFIICHDFNPSVWHTQRMTNFVTIFLWRFFAPVWHSLEFYDNYHTKIVQEIAQCERFYDMILHATILYIVSLYRTMAHRRQSLVKSCSVRPA